MISDGIENCLQYLNNFNPAKSNNPFAYFTQIIYFAFIRRIQKEKKQVTIKHKTHYTKTIYDDCFTYNQVMMVANLRISLENFYKRI